MSSKRSANAGDYKKAKSALANRGGFIEGSPESILISLGFDGGWKEFRDFIGAEVNKIDLGRYTVQLLASSVIKEAPKQVKTFDPASFAVCASNYVLGIGDPTDFEKFEGDYGQTPELICALAETIDVSISTVRLPYQTATDMEIYRLERSLNYTAAGDGRFCVYGAQILQMT